MQYREIAALLSNIDSETRCGNDIFINIREDAVKLHQIGNFSNIIHYVDFLYDYPEMLDKYLYDIEELIISNV
jgi:hypothetical protein